MSPRRRPRRDGREVTLEWLSERGLRVMNVSDQNPRGCDCAYLSWGHAVGAVTDTLVDSMAVNDDDDNVEVRHERCIVVKGRRMNVTSQFRSVMCAHPRRFGR